MGDPWLAASDARQTFPQSDTIRPSMRLPLPLTFFIAKLAQIAISRLGRGGGSALPGLLAERLNAKLFPYLSSQLQGIIVVAGTNGKTTTSRLVASFLEGADYKIIHNRSGSNLVRGLISTLIKQANWHIKLHNQWAVFEVDEAVVPQVLATIKPDYFLALNLFRDQLDRYGEINTLGQKWRQACQNLPATSTIILNADDPLVNSLSLDTPAKVVRFSLVAGQYGQKTTHMARHADSRRCPLCGANLEFQAINYSHLGQYHCPNGDYQPPSAEVLANKVNLNGLNSSQFTIHYQDQAYPQQLNLAGLYNIYNALAANALGLSLGLDPAMLQQRTTNFEAVFGRLEQIKFGSSILTLILVKNPTGYNQVLQTLATDQQPKQYWLILNDFLADGRDISWIWDVEFEQMAAQAKQVLISGSRLNDLHLRLKYAGLQSSQIQPAKNAADGLRLLSQSTEQHIYCLCTYTSMLELRKLLQKHQLVKSYHQE